MKLFFSTYKTGTGWGAVVAGDNGLLEVILPFMKNRDEMIEDLRKKREICDKENSLTIAAASQLTEYFEGNRQIFDLKLDMSGFTPFRQHVYSMVMEIPYGSVRSYGGIAEALGKPGAARGVGSAMGANPMPVVIPCHRVLGAKGGLTGYSAPGGIETKKSLLEMEGFYSTGKASRNPR